MANPVASGKMAQQGPPPAVLYKLILFAVLMAFAPIATYFGTLKYVWNGSTTPSAICAIVAANLVLVGYVVVAFREDIDGPSGVQQPAARLAERKKDR